MDRIDQPRKGSPYKRTQLTQRIPSYERSRKRQVKRKTLNQ